MMMMMILSHQRKNIVYLVYVDQCCNISTVLSDVLHLKLTEYSILEETSIDSCIYVLYSNV